jgi:hypothetical protein
MLGINSFPKDVASNTEPKIVGYTAMTETSPDETTLSGRAQSRIQYEGSKQQQNLENIAFNAVPFIKEDGKPDDIEEDWLANFFDKGRLISDIEMQKLWSHVLASEVNQPRSFSARTVNLLASLSKEEALLFKKLCSYNWVDEDPKYGLYFTTMLTREMINKPDRYGISISDLYNLQDIGLLIYGDNDTSQFAVGGYEKEPLIFDYHGHRFELRSMSEQREVLTELQEVGVGQVKLSYSGRELARICAPEPDFDYMNYAVKYWQEQDVHVTVL